MDGEISGDHRQLEETFQAASDKPRRHRRQNEKVFVLRRPSPGMSTRSSAALAVAFLLTTCFVDGGRSASVTASKVSLRYNPGGSFPGFSSSGMKTSALFGSSGAGAASVTGISSSGHNSNNGAGGAGSAFSSKAKILAQVGTDAVLPCRLRDSGLAGGGAVSWMKRGQYDVLTVGNTTYTDDPRFKPGFLPELGEWALRIFPVELNDTGTYQCQVSSITHPPTAFVELRVIRAVSEISGKEIHVNSGSVLNLRCIVRNLIQKPSFIFWYHTPKDPLGAQPQLMNYESRVKMSIVDGEVDPMNQTSTPNNNNNNNNNNHHQHHNHHSSARNGNNNKNDNNGHQPGRLEFRQQQHQQQQQQQQPTAMTVTVTALAAPGNGDPSSSSSSFGTSNGNVGFVVTGLLTIERVTAADSGNFTCSPQYAASSVISVHVLSDGEHQAAIQQGSAAALSIPTLPFLVAALSLLANASGAVLFRPSSAAVSLLVSSLLAAAVTYDVQR